LKIVGRKKVIFKLANGQYIIPEQVEMILIASRAVHQVIVFESFGCPDALIVPSLENLHLSGPRQIHEQLINEVNRLYNDHVESVARINKIHLCNEPWTIEKGDLTPSMKPRRKVILDKYLSNENENGYSTRI
jgi:long-chain acyl-CoA synthetase